MTHPTPAPDEALREKIAMVLLERRGFVFYTDPMEGGQDAYELTLEALAEADAILSLLSPPQRLDAPGVRKAWRIEYDGFEGVEIGSYTTLEGKQGVVLQQIGTRVVHVYGRRWLIALAALQPQAEAELRDKP